MKLQQHHYEWLLAMVEARAEEEANGAREARTDQQRTLARMSEMRLLELAQVLRDRLGEF